MNVETLRRIRLDACDEQANLTYFKGDPLDGIGVETRTARGVHPAQIWLWRYKAGRRTGPFLEPFFTGDQSVIIDSHQYEWADPDEAAMVVDGRRLNGLTAVLDDRHLHALHQISDGTPTDNYITWHPSGATKSIDAVDLVPIETGLVQVRQHAVFADTTAPGAGPTKASVVLGVGEEVPRNGIEAALPNAQVESAPTFRPFPPDRPRAFAASCQIGLNANGQVDHFELRGAEFFSFLKQHDLEIARIGWLPTSLPELIARGLSHHLLLEMPSQELTMVLDAFGGSTALDHITKLELASYNLEPHEIRPFFDLPQLKHIAIVDQDLPDDARGIRQMCAAAKAKRPNLTVMCDHREVTES